MYGFQEVVDSTLTEILTDSDSGGESGDFEARISDMMPELIEGTSAIVLDRINARFLAGDLEDYWREKRAFIARLREFWKEPLDLLELFITLATEVVTDFNGEYRSDSMRSGDAVFKTLTRLHARACQISWAIHTLLRSGFADDAHARWRSLHEISVVSKFISLHGQEVAERYISHGVVQRYKLACQMRKFRERNNTEPITDEEFKRLKSRCDRLVSQYDSHFREDFGWAADALNNSRPTFSALEEHVELDHMRPYYRMSSDNVHASSHGTFFRLGLSLPGVDLLLAGPSNAGLANPGHSAAVSLHQITTTLLSTRLSLDCAIAMKVLEQMVENVGVVFQKTHLELETLATEDYEAEKRN